MEEIWKDIPGYEGKYQASTMGNIKSVKRYLNTRSGRRLIDDRILKQQLIGKQRIKRYAVYLYDINTKKQVWKYSHYLVAITFPEICGEWFEGSEVHHIDFNPLNNSAYNIRILSIEEHENIHKHRICGETKWTNEYRKKYQKEYYLRRRDKYREHYKNTYKPRTEHTVYIYEGDTLITICKNQTEASKLLNVSKQAIYQNIKGEIKQIKNKFVCRKEKKVFETIYN